MNVAEQFGANLARCRKRAGISQEALSFLASLHRTAIGQLERGERIPRIDTLIKLAGAFGVTPSELLAGLSWEPGETVLGSFHASADGEI